MVEMRSFMRCCAPTRPCSLPSNDFPPPTRKNTSLAAAVALIIAAVALIIAAINGDGAAAISRN